jgi:hypothetical protein
VKLSDPIGDLARCGVISQEDRVLAFDHLAGEATSVAAFAIQVGQRTGRLMFPLPSYIGFQLSGLEDQHRLGDAGSEDFNTGCWLSPGSARTRSHRQPAASSNSEGHRTGSPALSHRRLRLTVRAHGQPAICQVSPEFVSSR